MSEVRPMSDGRFLVVVVALLGAGLGGAIVLLAGIAFLTDRVTGMGELGTPTDVTGELVAAIVLGAAMVLTGAVVAARSVLRQLRAR